MEKRHRIKAVSHDSPVGSGGVAGGRLRRPRSAVRRDGDGAAAFAEGNADVPAF